MPAPPPLPGGPRGAAAVTAGPIEAGDSKQFRTAARVGRWTVGQVFEGVVEPEGAPCAIVFPDVVGADVSPWLAAMRAEVQGNRALVGLPIVGWIYAGQTVDRRAFAVLPPLVGKALDAHVAETGPLDTLAALQLGVELADALTRAHARGRCLGEVAPAAVRLPTERAERLSMVDVGAARGLFRQTIQPVGADARFASPRVVAGEAPRPVDDVWAVGALLAWLLGAPDSADAPRRGVGMNPALGAFAPHVDGILAAALHEASGVASKRVTEMADLARALRGVRDLYRLSPEAQQAILALRPHEPAQASSVAPALAYVETDSGTSPRARQ